VVEGGVGEGGEVESRSLLLDKRDGCCEHLLLVEEANMPIPRSPRVRRVFSAHTLPGPKPFLCEEWKYSQLDNGSEALRQSELKVTV
jgi:hypothetical protein